jgi:hypothetical protein
MLAEMTSSRDVDIEQFFTGVNRLRSQLQSALYRECLHVGYVSICINETIPQSISFVHKYIYDARVELLAHRRSGSNPARCKRLAEASYIVTLIA